MGIGLNSVRGSDRDRIEDLINTAKRVSLMSLSCVHTQAVATITAIIWWITEAGLWVGEPPYKIGDIYYSD